MDLNIRPAVPQDSPAAGDLILATMAEMGEMIFGLGDSRRASAALASLFSYPDNRFSFTRTLIAEVEGQTAGLLLTFPGSHLGKLELPLMRQMVAVYHLEELLRLGWRSLPLAGHHETQRDEYYIAHLAVFPRYRGNGIGQALMHLAEEQCRQTGLQKCSLCVDFGHDAARHLYLKLGYQVSERHTNPPAVVRSLKWAGYERMVKYIP